MIAVLPPVESRHENGFWLKHSFRGKFSGFLDEKFRKIVFFSHLAVFTYFQYCEKSLKKKETLPIWTRNRFRDGTQKDSSNIYQRFNLSSEEDFSKIKNYKSPHLDKLSLWKKQVSEKPEDFWRSRSDKKTG